MKDGVLDAIKQNVYDACALDERKISTAVESLERQVGHLDNDNKALREELDTMEQYSRRNCLVVHGIPETKEHTSDAVLQVFNDQLNVRVTPDCIDRSHRLGRFQPSSNKSRSEVRELRDPPSSVLGQATTQRNQDRGHRESHEAEKRATELNENTARRHVRMDDGRPDNLPPPERRETHHRNRT